MSEKCRAPKCIRQVEIKKHGLCRTHLARFYRNGNVGSRPIKPKKDFRPYDANELDAAI